MEPRTPTHSLPSYDEPTPETGGKISREEEAERALKHTEFTAGARGILISLFLLTIVSVPTIQFFAGTWLKLNAKMFMRAETIKSFEKQLEEESVVSRWLLPRTQSLLTGKLGAGNEQVYLGRNGWLFYRPDVDYVTGSPFLSEAWQRKRLHAAKVQPDPIKAIVQFRDQLAARGIDLVIVPVPVKPAIEGAQLSTKAGPRLQNGSFEEFKNRLTSGGVKIFDPAPFYVETESEKYLTSDTHWKPETMELVVRKLAGTLQLPEIESQRPFQTNELEISGSGDVARMLRLAPDEQLYPRQRVTIHQITNGDAFWRPSADADVLVLGDSFANIFSQEGLGWGESAGFAEQLSRSLGDRPLDCILRNSDGAFATREILARDLARGRDRLAGKKLVIWEFAARELAFGNWKLLDLKLRQPGAAQFFSPKPGEMVEATGTIENLSLVPRPATVPYQDHVMTVQLSEIKISGKANAGALKAVVYLLSMHDNVWTAAGRLRVGDQITLRLRAWADIAAQYEGINRSELDDPALQLEEPAWGEIVK